MKVNIIWNIKEGPFGGGNQFLKRLKEQFVLMGLYSEPERADIFLFNSHHETDRVKEFKKIYSNKRFVHRIDGPMRLYNNENDTRDDVVIEMNSLADAIVFQSSWSMEHNCKKYPPIFDKIREVPYAVIHNACDVSVKKKQSSGKRKLIAVSMSDNFNKGYEIYKYLDENLDFDKYDFTFVGRSPLVFKNIVDLGVRNPDEVIDILSRHDIFITASKNDPCSNALIEALSVGLPSLVLSSGGHIEIVKAGGWQFEGKEDVLDALETLNSSYGVFEKNIDVKSMSEVAKNYLSFFEAIL